MKKRYTFSAGELETLERMHGLFRISRAERLPTAWAMALLRHLYQMPHEDRRDEYALRRYIAFVEWVCGVAGYACAEAVRNMRETLPDGDKQSLLSQARAAIRCMQLIEAALVAALKQEDGPPNGEPTKKP